jgi:pimeloyl-ACP methyl ester carboxylesterase
MSAARDEASSVLRRREYAGVGGLKIAADVGGDPQTQRTVLLLHGGGQTRASWGNAALALVEAGYAAIALDARGHGESGWAEGGNYQMEDFAGDVLGVIATLPQKPALVGASLGGITSLLALKIARERGEEPAAALVLVDIATRMNPEGAKKIGAFMHGKPEGFATLEEAADAVAAYLPHRKRPSDVSGLRKNLRQGEDGRWRWHWDPAFGRGPRKPEDMKMFQSMLDEAVRGLSVPTLLVRGGKSEIVTDDAVEHFRTLLPTAEHVNVQDASHMVAGDSNDAFNAAILDFLGRALKR